jgi:hypothetical protein
MNGIAPEWVQAIAAGAQALAMVVLIIVTIIYTRHTKRLAEEPRRQAAHERKSRIREAVSTLSEEVARIELLSSDLANNPAKRMRPVPLPTSGWEGIKGMAFILPPPLRDAVRLLYFEVDQCNTFWQKYLGEQTSAGDSIFTTQWNGKIQPLGDKAREVHEQLKGIDLDKTLSELGLKVE